MIYQACDRLLSELPAAVAADHGDKVALRYGNRSVTFSQLDLHSSQVAKGLAGQGVRQGDRVAILAKDSDWLVETLFGCAKAGAIFVCVNWRLTAAEIALILKDSGARTVFVDEGTEPKLPTGRDAVRNVVAYSTNRGEHPTYHCWRSAQLPDHQLQTASTDDVCALLYTSGTTGKPKGVQLPNRSFFGILASMRDAGDGWINLGPHDVSLHNLPMSHVGGLWWAAQSLNAGAELIIMDKFVAWQALDLIQRHGVTKFCMVPAMIQMVLNDPTLRPGHLSSVDHLIYGGSPISQSLLERARDAFRCKLVQFYGLTETGNTAVCLRPEDHHDLSCERVQSAGKPYPGVQVRCVDAEGRSLGPRQIGEFQVYSPANMVGYWNDEQATAETLRDGWIRTGDAGFLDEEGFLYIRDRMKDMIIYGGDNVFSAEVENAIATHPAVAEVAVIGVPHDRWGELVKAVIVPQRGQRPTVSDVVKHVRPLIADFKLPKSIDLVESLPRTSSGKVQKDVLREPYWEGRRRRVN